jgi:DNA-binding Xre family transcriptional regulator
MPRASACLQSRSSNIQADIPAQVRLAIDVGFKLVYSSNMRMSFEVDGQRLRELRVERALSLRALGERSGVAFDAINKLENGKRPARLATIRKLAEALSVEPKELMKREE